MYGVRKMRGKMPEEDHTYTLRELLRRDLKNLRIPALLFLIYFLIGRKFLYSLCPSVLLTGFPCPGCGLTRAVFSILKGNFAAAWYLNPFSYAAVILALMFAVQRYIRRKDVGCLKKYLAAAAVGMILFYIYRMLRYFPGEPPMSYYKGNLLNRILQMIKS